MKKPELIDCNDYDAYCKKDGEECPLCLMAGNHRLAQKLINGETTIEANVLGDRSGKSLQDIYNKAQQSKQIQPEQTIKDESKLFSDIPKKELPTFIKKNGDKLRNITQELEQGNIEEGEAKLQVEALKYGSVEEFIDNIDRNSLEVFKQEKIDKGEKFSFSDFNPSEFKSKKEWANKVFIPQLTDIYNKAHKGIEDAIYIN